MTMFKKMVLAVSLLVASNFASAAVYNLNLIDNTVDTQVVGIGAPGTFGDLFNFTLAEDLVVNQVLDSLGDFGVPNSIGFSLYDTNGIVFVAEAVPGFDGKLRIEDVLLSAGSYATYVTGIMNGPFGGYAFSTSVSPVPEASTLAMMLGGLGLVGFMARRRKAG